MVLSRVNTYNASQYFESLKRDRFTILVFYRGSWCGFCNNYLSSINPVVKKIKQLGGKIIAVSSQNIETVRQPQEDLQLTFPMISDEQNTLAKQCKVEVTEKKNSLYQKMILLAKKFKVNTQYLETETNYMQGISQPAVIVWDSRQNIIFNWKKYPSFANLYGASDRIPMEEVLTVVEYQLSPSYESVSAKIRVKLESNRELFEQLLGDPKLKKKFVEHLKKERTIEMLEFVEQVEEWELLEDEKKGKKEMEIYNLFLMEQASKEVNLPHEIKQSVCAHFEKLKAEEGQETSNRVSLSHSLAKLSLHTVDYEKLIHEAYMHIKGTLYIDSYPRFQATSAFFELATSLPQFFVVTV